VGGAGEAVEGTLSEEWVAEERDPFVDGAVTGDDGAGVLVALRNALTA
jgi:hypothetical protein